MTIIGIEANKSFAEKTFTTKSKLKRLVLHKQRTVRNRVCALQESFYPTVEVPYAAVKMRMVSLLGIVDRISVLAYLGRPETVLESFMEQTVTYRKTGTVVPKSHKFKRKLKAKRGYIDLFGLGYVYSDENGWWIHWNHMEQLTLQEVENGAVFTTESEYRGV